MDEQVLQSMRRWPDVPAVSGWLSLDRRGAWRLHEHGGANEGEAGVAIAHPGMIAFINRNYASDAQGRWYFQNGPQRVYVTLAATPLVLRRDGSGQGLETHTGQPAGTVHAWWLDQHGLLYASLDAGCAVVDDRDLEYCADQLQLTDGRTLLEAWETWDEPACQEKTQAKMPENVVLALPEPSAALQQAPQAMSVPLYRVEQSSLPARLGFVTHPVP